MTVKAERELRTHLAVVEQELALHRAMRIHPTVEPDLPPPVGHGDQLSKGWDQWTYGEEHRVEKACSSSIHHGGGWERTSAQNPRRLHSTRKLALLAARGEMSRRFAKVLASIEAEIVAEEAAERGGLD